MTDQRPNESLHAYLKRRERELLHQISAIQGELAPREFELIEVRRAMEAVGLPTGNVLTDVIRAPEGGWSAGLTNFLDTNEVSTNTAIGPGALAGTNALYDSTQQPTIKQLILRAFTDQFRDGATPAELRAYIHDAYGREVDRTSMGPQLSRLRDEGLIEQMIGMLNEGKWTLKLRGELVNAIDLNKAESGKRESKLYNHPSSKKMR